MIEVIARGEGFVAVNKPPGRIVVPGRGAAARELPLRAEVEQQLGQSLWVVHRLDRGTSGVLLFAVDADAHRALSMAFERNQVTKRYWALCRGTLVGDGVIDSPLVAIRGGRVRVGRPGEPGAKASRTRWRAVERFPGLTAVELAPESGRLHQIRAHLASIGHPLVVDPIYGVSERLCIPERAAGGDGSEPVWLERTPLHALSVKLSEPATGRTVRIEAPLPRDLSDVVAALRRRPVEPSPGGA